MGVVIPQYAPFFMTIVSVLMGLISATDGFWACKMVILVVDLVMEITKGLKIIGKTIYVHMLHNG
jgi:hypothetical protein